MVKTNLKNLVSNFNYLKLLRFRDFVYDLVEAVNQKRFFAVTTFKHTDTFTRFGICFDFLEDDATDEFWWGDTREFSEIVEKVIDISIPDYVERKYGEGWWYVSLFISITGEKEEALQKLKKEVEKLKTEIDKIVVIHK